MFARRLLRDADSQFIGDLLSIKPISYAPRKIYANQTTPAYIYRNAGGVEIDSVFGSDGWIDTAQLLQHAAGGNVTVKQAYDASPFGYHAVELNPANQPLIVVAGVLQTINGRPSLFNDANRRLVASNPTLTQPNYLSAVAHNPTFFGTGEVVIDAQNAVSRNVLSYNSASTVGYFAGGTPQTSGTITADVPLIFGNLFAGTSSYLRRNGTQILSGNAGTAALGNISLMAVYSFTSAYAFNGFLSEVFIFNGTPTATDIALLERDQSLNYGITVT